MQSSPAEGRTSWARTIGFEDNLANSNPSSDTALTMADRKRESDRAQEAVASALSSLELGIPERVSRANAKADGATTPLPVCVSLFGPSPLDARADLSPATFFPLQWRSQRTEGHSRAESESVQTGPAGDQVVTPWDVQGAVVEGKQVR